ncbi:MAG TPA: DALR domain-containing protein [Trebonia sp.]
MTLCLHDAATGAVREFRPAAPGRVSVCLQVVPHPREDHIGSVRPAICLDILVRWLEASGYQVTYRRDALGRADDLLGCRLPDADVRLPARVSGRDEPVVDIAGGDGVPLSSHQARYRMDLSRAEPAVPLNEALSRARPQDLRYYLLGAHYRAPIKYCDAEIEEAAAAYQGIERFVARARRMPGISLSQSPERELADHCLPLSFIAAMDDDLDVTAALASVHATVHDGNYAISSGDRDTVITSLGQVRSMLGVLGLDPLHPRWAPPDATDRLYDVIDTLVGLALRQWESARGRGDYASADSIRDTLEDLGVVFDDSSAGPRWELKR